TPASSSTRRCLVTAWRVSAVPSARREIDCGVPSASLASMARRVGSPSAAKIEAWTCASRGRLRCLFDMLFDVAGLPGPAAFVHAKGLVAAMLGDPVEARLDHAHMRSRSRWGQRELDQSRLLLGIVGVRVDRIRVPG